MAVQPWEDCVSLNPATSTLEARSGNYYIVDGTHQAFFFGPNKAEAEKSLAIIKAYKMSRSCFVGRPGPSMNYLLTASGEAPSGSLVANEDCIDFNNATVEAKWFGDLNSWKIVDGNMWMLDFGLAQDEVYQALRVIKTHGFNQQCFVGRPDPSFTYWKIKAPTRPKADLVPEGYLRIGKALKTVKAGGIIELTPADANLISNGVPAFDIHYVQKNIGGATAAGYKNKILQGVTEVSIQSELSLAAGASQPIHTQAYLRPGAARDIHLSLDAGAQVGESNESNNQLVFSVKFTGF